MQIIPLAFYLIMLEFAVGSCVALYALEARRDSSIGFVQLQAFLNLAFFSLLAWLTMRGFATAHQIKLDGFNLDFAWLNWMEPLLNWFLILQIPYAILTFTKRFTLRMVVGGITTLVGVACLFVTAMSLRGIADAHLAGAFTVAAFLAGALGLGGVGTAMLLGHWYLNTPTASGKPLEFATTLTIIGIVAQIAFGLLAGPVTYIHPTTTALAPPITKSIHTGIAQPAPQLAPLATTTPTPTSVTTVKSPVPHGVTFNNTILLLLEYALGLGFPLILSGIALKLVKERSFQSATGMLYIAVVFVFFGEILARGLFLQPLI